MDSIFTRRNKLFSFSRSGYEIKHENLNGRKVGNSRRKVSADDSAIAGYSVR